MCHTIGCQLGHRSFARFVCPACQLITCQLNSSLPTDHLSTYFQLANRRIFKPTSWWPSSIARRPCYHRRGGTAAGKDAGECGTASLAAPVRVPRRTAQLPCSSVARRRQRRRTTPFVNKQPEGLRQAAPTSSAAGERSLSWGDPK